MCLRWSNNDAYEGPFASVRLLTLDHQKTLLINFNPLTSLSHKLVDPSRRPALIYFVLRRKVLHANRYISLMLSFHFFAQRERSFLVPCNYPNTPTHKRTTSSTSHPCSASPLCYPSNPQRLPPINAMQTCPLVNGSHYVDDKQEEEEE